MPRPSDFASFLSADMAAMEILLTAKAEKTAVTIEEFIRLSLLNGVSEESLLNELERDLNENGRIFSEFRSAIKATSNGVIKRASDSGQVSVLEEIENYRWVAVADKNVCDDCISRHGEVKTWDEWEEAGLPATGYTVCKERCRCVLIPENIVKIEPVSLEGK